MLIIVIRMDIIFDKSAAKRDILSAFAGKKVIVGAKQLRKALKSGIIACVFLASDADPAITDSLVEACRACNVDVVWVRSMSELGRACGIDVGAAAAATVE